MSCLAGPTRNASSIVFLTQMTKHAQQIGDYTRDKVSNSTLFCLRENLFLIHLSCRYQKQPSLTCQKQDFELEEDNFTHKISPEAYQKVCGYSSTHTRTQHTTCPKGFCSLFILYIVCLVCLCQNCNPQIFPEFQNCKSFYDNLKAPGLQIISFMEFVNALHLDSFPI
jgi:hypothetical protein